MGRVAQGMIDPAAGLRPGDAGFTIRRQGLYDSREDRYFEASNIVQG